MISSLSLHVSWKPTNPQECEWKNLYRNIMRTISQEKEQFTTIVRFGTRVCSYASSNEVTPQQKQQWIKNGRNLKRFRRGTQKSETNLKWLMKQEKKVEKSLMDLCHLKNAELETKHQKYKGRVCAPRRHCARWFWVLCNIHKTRIISITNDGRKGHGYHIETARLCRTSSWRSICIHSGQNGRCSKIIENSNSECPDIWNRLPRHKWPKSWSSMEDPVVLLERNLCGHPLAGLLWERQFEKILLKYDCEKVSNWECLFVHREKRIILICVCGWHQIGWKETKYWSDVESTKERSWFGRTNIIPWSCILGVYSKTMWKKQRYCRQLQNHVWTQNFRWINRKIPCSENLCISSCSYDMEGHVKKCVERYYELANKTIQQLHKVSIPCVDDHHFKEEELKTVGDLSKVCSQIVLKFWNLGRIGRPDIPSMVSEQNCTCDHKMDQSLWQTIISFDLPHSSHKWTQTTLSCGKHCKTMQTGTVPRLRFCRRSWRLKIFV